MKNYHFSRKKTFFMKKKMKNFSMIKVCYKLILNFVILPPIFQQIFPIFQFCHLFCIHIFKFFNFAVYFSMTFLKFSILPPISLIKFSNFSINFFFNFSDFSILLPFFHYIFQFCHPLFHQIFPLISLINLSNFLSFPYF